MNSREIKARNDFHLEVRGCSFHRESQSIFNRSAEAHPMESERLHHKVRRLIDLHGRGWFQRGSPGEVNKRVSHDRQNHEGGVGGHER